MAWRLSGQTERLQKIQEAAEKQVLEGVEGKTTFH
jgi:hypothetical protein